MNTNTTMPQGDNTMTATTPATTSPIARFMEVFRKEFYRRIRRGIWDLQFALRSSPFDAWTGIDSSAVHVYGLDGALEHIVPVKRGDLIRNPEAAAADAATRLEKAW